MNKSSKYQPNNLNYKHYVLVELLRLYIRGKLNNKTEDNIRIAAEEIALDDWFVCVIEIAYHIGYAHSLLNKKMSEVTYKNMKKQVKENIIKRCTYERIS